MHIYITGNPDSSVGIATGYGLHDQGEGVGVRVPVGSKIFTSIISSRPALQSTQPHIKLISGVKQQGHEADHSPTTSTEVMKMWIYISTPPYVFMA
jgi:hypothetical protein